MALCCRREIPTIDEEEARKHTESFVETKKILLLGTGESGKTTIIKQMKILHINGFSDDDRKRRISDIKCNIHESIYDIINNMSKINPPTEVKQNATKSAIDYLLSLGPKGPEEFNEEYFDNVKTAWADEGVKETFQRSNEYQLIDSAEHFLDRLDAIRKPDYIPDDQDILFCRVETKSISKIEFEVPLSKFEGGKARFWMYDVGGQRGGYFTMIFLDLLRVSKKDGSKSVQNNRTEGLLELLTRHRKRWIQAFDGIQAILFLISASDFDQKLREDPSKNRLQEAFDLLREIHRSKFVREAGLIVFLNKQDILEKKILQQHRKLEVYFPDYANYTPSKKEEWDGKNEYIRAKLFMRHKVLCIASTPVKIENVGFVPGYNINEELPPREVHVHFTVATDTNNIRRVFESVREIILRDITGKVFSL